MSDQGQITDAEIAGFLAELNALSKRDVGLSAINVLARANSRIADLETVARECLGWIRHWQADVAGNLKPTPDSLAMKEAKLAAILEATP